MKYLIFVIISLVTTKTYALNYNSFIGTSLIYANPTNSSPVNKYEQIKNPAILSVNYGQAFYKNDFIVKIGTNRLYNKSQERQLIIDDKQILNKSKITSDHITVEKLIKYCGVGFFISNAKLEQQFYYNNILIEKNKKWTTLYGLSTSTYFNDNISMSLNYIIENKEFGFSAYLLSINYNF